MATTKAKATKAAEPASEPAPDAQAVHDGWAHDWRNPDATFAADDYCPNAVMRRLADR